MSLVKFSTCGTNRQSINNGCNGFELWRVYKFEYEMEENWYKTYITLTNNKNE